MNGAYLIIKSVVLAHGLFNIINPYYQVIILFSKKFIEEQFLFQKKQYIFT